MSSYGTLPLCISHTSAAHACRPKCAVQKHCSVIVVHLKEGIEPCRAIAEVMGYTHCTAVQAESLGPLLSGADMVVKAKTGTGKTLAFLIPGIEQVSSLTSSLDTSMPASIACGVFVTPCQLTGKPAVSCAIVVTAHSRKRRLPHCGSGRTLTVADAAESTKQKHWNACGQSHKGAGGTDCRRGQAAHGLPAELHSAGAVSRPCNLHDHGLHCSQNKVLACKLVLQCHAVKQHWGPAILYLYPFTFT